MEQVLFENLQGIVSTDREELHRAGAGPNSGDTVHKVGHSGKGLTLWNTAQFKQMQLIRDLILSILSYLIMSQLEWQYLHE